MLLSNKLKVTAYPNPFSSSVTFQYILPEPGRVWLSVYNGRGQRVKISVQQQGVGRHNQVLHLADQPSGLYYYRLQAEHRFSSGMLIKLDR